MGSKSGVPSQEVRAASLARPEPGNWHSVTSILVYGCVGHRACPDIKEKQQSPHVSVGGDKEFAAIFNMLPWVWGDQPEGRVLTALTAPVSGPHPTSDCLSPESCSWASSCSLWASGLSSLLTAPWGSSGVLYSMMIMPQILADAYLGATFSQPGGFLPSYFPMFPNLISPEGNSFSPHPLPQVFCPFHVGSFADSALSLAVCP